MTETPAAPAIAVEPPPDLPAAGPVAPAAPAPRLIRGWRVVLIASSALVITFDRPSLISPLIGALLGVFLVINLSALGALRRLIVRRTRWTRRAVAIDLAWLTTAAAILILREVPIDHPILQVEWPLSMNRSMTQKARVVGEDFRVTSMEGGMLHIPGRSLPPFGCTIEAPQTLIGRRLVQSVSCVADERAAVQIVVKVSGDLDGPFCYTPLYKRAAWHIAVTVEGAAGPARPMRALYESQARFERSMVGIGACHSLRRRMAVDSADVVRSAIEQAVTWEDYVPSE